MKKNKWIFIRGLGRGHGHWGTFINKFESAVPNDRVYWLDLSGNGFLNNKVSPLTIPKYILALEEQLKVTDFFQVEGKTIGVGLSFGAMVMTEWSQQQNQIFDKMFLINTSAANFSKPWKRISFRVFLNAIRQLLTAKVEKFELNSLYFTTNLSFEKITNEFQDSYQAVIQFSKNYPIKKINILRQLIAASRYFFPKKMPCLVILLNGAKDRFVNPLCSADIKMNWSCDLWTHPTAGHDIAFEDPNWLIDKLKL